MARTWQEASLPHVCHSRRGPHRERDVPSTMSCHGAHPGGPFGTGTRPLGERRVSASACERERESEYVLVVDSCGGVDDDGQVGVQNMGKIALIKPIRQLGVERGDEQAVQSRWETIIVTSPALGVVKKRGWCAVQERGRHAYESRVGVVTRLLRRCG